MLTYIQPFDATDSFPPLEYALSEPNGLIAIGGDLRPERLLQAYRSGIFPWFNDGQPIMWWSPDPRMVLYPTDFHASRSLRKSVKKNLYRISFDQAFSTVIHQCSQPRPYARDTWITDSMKEAYLQLHLLGHAHSVEIWSDKKLVGGLYGIAIGKAFFGESMFSLATDVSKMAFLALSRFATEQGFEMIDCQVYSEHLQTLGAHKISREKFSRKLQQLIVKADSTEWNRQSLDLNAWLNGAAKVTG
jgi:leucyl/phenylalanyl-tRNA--protein transferase